MNKLSRRNQDQERSLQPLSLRDAFTRLFDESVWDPFGFFSENMPMTQLRTMNRFSPRVDVSEDSKEISVKIDVPGYDPKDIDVQVKEGFVYISGKMEQRMEEEDKDKTYFRRERRTGNFNYEVPLPSYADEEKAQATIKNGTLMITMPKKPEKKGKGLKIQVEA